MVSQSLVDGSVSAAKKCNRVGFCFIMCKVLAFCLNKNLQVINEWCNWGGTLGEKALIHGLCVQIITGPSSPLKRKASLAHNLEKLEKALDGARSLHSSATCLVHDVEGGLPPEAKPQSLPQSGKGKGTTPAKEEHPMLKYLKTQVLTCVEKLWEQLFFATFYCS